ncbi:CRISPR-associated endonuclease Cas2 [Pasteurella atlantica]|uniref:CRISPR-associated endoribonuclease Cas2 n=3 Tax=Pasteurellaceae TaxID=712 RepID=A0AAJ6NCX4_9PAST|nr:MULTISPECIES: CRISPR-associated endonuclease Cas2 [Pasteurella]MDP8033569.1 CRISPR-associated endonuclease Cas2 [Pasteurella atlantica]MDP8035504.1 CRISPR-associated endonuclease Cas2 [Pasteurella atlantica]MDP8037455.1 CRISPR-associated endonuclease Cas2 [Pasteurella atlantica]MDP8047804.1 CRISPR-associated endonuclease Cas2 [Pasteurella atlantica]MDP8049635.1 CRISPR-associated endonuclease Cas2 [Pasteurella atlantica]
MQVSRLRYLIAYDICDSKRLYKVHKKVETYAIGGQESFYECWLTESELITFKQELVELLDLDEDRIFIFQIPLSTKPLLFGKAELQSISPFLIV